MPGQPPGARRGSQHHAIQLRRDEVRCGCSPVAACGNAAKSLGHQSAINDLLLHARFAEEAGLLDGVFNVVRGDKVAGRCLARSRWCRRSACRPGADAEYIYARERHQQLAMHRKRA
jgi:hypothetical protein